MFDSVVLNEASLPFESIKDCEDNIQTFFDLLHEAKNKNVYFSRADEIEGNWNHLNYADGFNFDKWLYSIEDKDRQRQIKSVITNLKCPLVNMTPNKSNVDVSKILFFHESNRDSEVFGLAFAHLNHSHSLSVASKSCWLEDSISIIKAYYVDDSYQELEVNVPNISSIQQFQIFLDNFKALRQTNKSYLASLKVKDNDDFENLLFTESFLKSVATTSLQPIDFKQLITVLESLNKAIMVSENLQQLAQNARLTITNESDTTMRNRTLARLRRFKHPVLGNQTFEAHIKNFINGKRMHILADYSEKKICVGYFGNHLQT